MDSREFFTSLAAPVRLFVLLLPFVLVSCASHPPVGDTQAPPAQESLSPQQAAARELIARGRRHLDKLQTDEAIRDLERALSLDPADGQITYYLAEAWLQKLDARRAGQFNRMAENHFKGDPRWTERIARQGDRIAELEK